ncbi:MAG: Pelagibacter phage [Bacteroidota bacterium]|jgi:hypothetical protein
MNDQPKNKIYLNLIPNVNKKAGDNQPVFVAPISPKAPEGKQWRVNVMINNEWYDYCAFDGTDMEGNATGGYTVILTKKEATQNKAQGFKPAAGGFQKKPFTSNKSFGNRNY